MSIQELIAGVGERLTPTERRIAEAVLDDPVLLAFGTVSDLANRVETSRPSIVRFATKLGFEGYADLQGWARDGVARQLTTPSDRIRQRPDEAQNLRPGIERGVQDALANLDSERVARLASPILGADQVWILSGETSRAGAHALRSGLSMVRGGVHLIEEHNLGRDLTNASRGDAAIVIDFARYRRWTVLAARALVERGVELVAITDGPLSPLVSLTDNWCALRVPAVGPFDSSIPAVLAAELLVHEVASRLGPEAQNRLDRLEQMWSETETYHDMTADHSSPRTPGTGSEQ